MGESTIIARKFIKNYVRLNAIKPYTIQIKNDLLKSIKWARQRYGIHQEEQKKFSKEKMKNEQLVEVSNELQTITAQCSMLENTVKKLDALFVDMMEKAEERTWCTLTLKGMH